MASETLQKRPEIERQRPALPLEAAWRKGRLTEAEGEAGRGRQEGGLRQEEVEGKMNQEAERMPEEFWHVYNYLARQWYETEYGKVPYRERHYGLAMDFMSLRAAAEMTRLVNER